MVDICGLLTAIPIAFLIPSLLSLRVHYISWLDERRTNPSMDLEADQDLLDQIWSGEVERGKATRGNLLKSDASISRGHIAGMLWRESPVDCVVLIASVLVTAAAVYRTIYF